MGKSRIVCGDDGCLDLPVRPRRHASARGTCDGSSTAVGSDIACSFSGVILFRLCFVLFVDRAFLITLTAKQRTQNERTKRGTESETRDDEGARRNLSLERSLGDK